MISKTIRTVSQIASLFTCCSLFDHNLSVRSKRNCMKSAFVLIGCAAGQVIRSQELLNAESNGNANRVLCGPGEYFANESCEFVPKGVPLPSDAMLIDSYLSCRIFHK